MHLSCRIDAIFDENGHMGIFLQFLLHDEILQIFISPYNGRQKKKNIEKRT